MTSHRRKVLRKAQLPERLNPARHHGLWARLEVWNPLALMPFPGDPWDSSLPLETVKILIHGAFLFLESKVAGWVWKLEGGGFHYCY